MPMTVPGEQGAEPYAAPPSPHQWAPTPPSPHGWTPTEEPYGWLDGPGYRPPLGHPSSRAALVVRVLIAVGLVIGMSSIASQPVERTTNDLLVALQNGDVRSLTIERPAGMSEDVTAGSAGLRVEWSGTDRPAYATYLWSFGDDAGTDEGTMILDAAEEAGVEVQEITTDPFGFSGTAGVTWHPIAAVGLLAAFAVLILLIASPQPRLATKWAWFWLGCAITPLWLVFVVLEPLPLWANRPQPLARNRLTGGWAFLLGIVLATLASWAWPEWADLLTS